MKNKPDVVIPDMPVSGDGLDIAQLMNIFAAKTPPENTIKRIEALEQQVAELSGRPIPEPVL